MGNNASIIPALSNNSHELFHSNLWKWLLENDKKFIKCFFDDCDLSHDFEVKREKLNTDLLIEDKTTGKYYVIENKLKSIANEEQLNRYKEKIGKKAEGESKYLLVYLIKNKQLEAPGWNSVDYIGLAKRIKKVLYEEQKDKNIIKYYALLNEYCNYIINEFNDIANGEYVKDETYYFGENGIKDIGLKVIYQKMKAEKFKILLDKEIKIKKWEQKFEKKKLRLVSNLGYNHGKPCFTYRIQWKKEDLQNHSAIEIQLEGYQHRHMVRLIKENKDKAKKIKEKRKTFIMKRL